MILTASDPSLRRPSATRLPKHRCRHHTYQKDRYRQFVLHLRLLFSERKPNPLSVHTTSGTFPLQATTRDTRVTHYLSRSLSSGSRLLFAALGQNLAMDWPADLTPANDLAFVFKENLVRPECCVDPLRPPRSIRPVAPNGCYDSGMPDRRSSTNRKTKKSCRCTHGIAIHHAKNTPKGMTHSCWYPGCKCKDYRPVLLAPSNLFVSGLSLVPVYFSEEIQARESPLLPASSAESFFGVHNL